MVGIDCNGVSREFINCLCDVMFSGRNPDGLFRAFKEDDMQSLVRKLVHYIIMTIGAHTLVSFQFEYVEIFWSHANNCLAPIL